MIGRASAKAIADAYHARFTGYSSGHRSTSSSFTYYKTSLYDFLYVANFDGWLLNAIRGISSVDSRGLLDFIMRLHTGESVVAATKDWSWKQREALGQRLLHNLAEAIIADRIKNPSGTYFKRKDEI